MESVTYQASCDLWVVGLVLGHVAHGPLQLCTSKRDTLHMNGLRRSGRESQLLFSPLGRCDNFSEICCDSQSSFSGNECFRASLTCNFNPRLISGHSMGFQAARG